MPLREVVRVECSQIVGADRAETGGGAIDPPVMDAHQMPVPGHPDITLQPVGALLEGQHVRGQGVLGQLRRRTPVSHYPRGDPVSAAHRPVLDASALDASGLDAPGTRTTTMRRVAASRAGLSNRVSRCTTTTVTLVTRAATRSVAACKSTPSARACTPGRRFHSRVMPASS